MLETIARPPRTARRAPALGSVALTLLMVGMLGLGAAVTLAPRLVGAVPLAVESHAMEPSLAQGDLVVVRPVDPAHLAVGDVVAYRPVPGVDRLVTRRVIEVHSDDGAVTAVQTQGDANLAPDDPITPDQLKGRAAYSVPLIGQIAQQPWALATVTLAGLLLAALTAAMLIAPSRRA